MTFCKEGYIIRFYVILYVHAKVLIGCYDLDFLKDFMSVFIPFQYDWDTKMICLSGITVTFANLV